MSAVIGGDHAGSDALFAAARADTADAGTCGCQAEFVFPEEVRIALRKRAEALYLQELEVVRLRTEAFSPTSQLRGATAQRDEARAAITAALAVMDASMYGDPEVPFDMRRELEKAVSAGNKLTALDPAGCSCTDCILGLSRALENSSAVERDLCIAGSLQNRTGLTLDEIGVY